MLFSLFLFFTFVIRSIIFLIFNATPDPLIYSMSEWISFPSNVTARSKISNFLSNIFFLFVLF